MDGFPGRKGEKGDLGMPGLPGLTVSGPKGMSSQFAVGQ
jgi:hypothetical protein